MVAGVRDERLRQRLRTSRRGWFASAAAVVLAIIAATAWWTSGNQFGDVPKLQADAHDVEISSPATAQEAPAAIKPPPRVEVDMTQEEVRVYQYAIGDDATTGAVFIVNPAMEL